MKTSTNHPKYKLYFNGTQFLIENQSILESSSKVLIQTAFFLSNARSYKLFNQHNYAFRFEMENEYLWILKCEPYNTLLYGSKKLTEYAAKIIADYNLKIGNILGEQEMANSFLNAYQKRLGGEIQIQHTMQIMVLKELTTSNQNKVFQCELSDLDDLVECAYNFYKEALHQEVDCIELRNQIQEKITDFYAIKVAEQIVCFASKTRDMESICAISHVYTIPEFRGRGYAKNVVSKITADILQAGKIPYLYVDTTNTTANHLYVSLGYQYFLNQVQCKYVPTTIRKAIFAGGCFWCIAEPFYSCEGVLSVYSGYVGGMEVDPTYEEVKYGDTQHREAILIEYDSTKVTYYDLLQLYFDHIDPYDGEGQFIDRGHNYTCAIFTSDIKERQEVMDYIQSLKTAAQKEIYVELKEDMVFYMAEEEHQNYALKNPDAIREEFVKSGRLNKGEQNNG